MRKENIILPKVYRRIEYIYGCILEKIIEHTKKLDFEMNPIQRNEKIIVSMASYCERYSNIVISLKSILVQSVKPDKIIVWLDEDNSKNKITKEMKELEKFGVEYRYTLDGLKAHKKYYYAMQEFRDACIITVDDDLVYSPNMIKSLIKCHERYPDKICARRVHKITFDKEKNVNKYTEWIYECRSQMEASYELFATGGAGTLYPPGCLNENAFDKEVIKEFCLNADDIWLKFMELMNGKEVVWAKNHYVMPKEIRNSQEEALNIGNVINGENDTYFKQLLERYPEVKKYF